MGLLREVKFLQQRGDHYMGANGKLQKNNQLLQRQYAGNVQQLNEKVLQLQHELQEKRKMIALFKSKLEEQSHRGHMSSQHSLGEYSSSNQSDYGNHHIQRAQRPVSRHSHGH